MNVCAGKERWFQKEEEKVYTCDLREASFHGLFERGPGFKCVVRVIILPEIPSGGPKLSLAFFLRINYHIFLSLPFHSHFSLSVRLIRLIPLVCLHPSIPSLLFKNPPSKLPPIYIYLKSHTQSLPPSIDLSIYS